MIITFQLIDLLMICASDASTPLLLKYEKGTSDKTGSSWRPLNTRLSAGEISPFYMKSRDTAG